MLLIILAVAAVWTIVSLAVIGCCVSAAQGDGYGWGGNPASRPRVRLLRARKTAAEPARRTGHAA